MNRSIWTVVFISMFLIGCKVDNGYYVDGLYAISDHSIYDISSGRLIANFDNLLIGNPVYSNSRSCISYNRNIAYIIYGTQLYKLNTLSRTIKGVAIDIFPHALCRPYGSQNIFVCGYFEKDNQYVLNIYDANETLMNRLKLPAEIKGCTNADVSLDGQLFVLEDEQNIYYMSVKQEIKHIGTVKDAELVGVLNDGVIIIKNKILYKVGIGNDQKAIISADMAVMSDDRTKIAYIVVGQNGDKALFIASFDARNGAIINPIPVDNTDKSYIGGIWSQDSKRVSLIRRKILYDSDGNIKRGYGEIIVCKASDGTRKVIGQFDVEKLYSMVWGNR